MACVGLYPTGQHGVWSPPSCTLTEAQSPQERAEGCLALPGPCPEDQDGLPELELGSELINPHIFGPRCVLLTTVLLCPKCLIIDLVGAPASCVLLKNALLVKKICITLL